MSIVTKLFIGLVVDPCIGQWFTVCDSDDVDAAFEQIEALAKRHGAEEVMIADCQPSWLSKIERSDLGEVVEWCAETHHSESLVAAVVAHDSAAFRDILDEGCVSGPHASAADYAEAYFDETGGLSECPENLKAYIDWESMARDWILSGDVCELDCNDGHYYYSSNY